MCRLFKAFPAQTTFQAFASFELEIPFPGGFLSFHVVGAFTLNFAPRPMIWHHKPRLSFPLER
jgi:hypothetical protein